jgi:hypothetical protein
MIISKGKMKEKFPKNFPVELTKVALEVEDMEEGDSLTIESSTKMEAMKMAINIGGYLTVNEYNSYQIILEGSKVRIDYVG